MSKRKTPADNEPSTETQNETQAMPVTNPTTLSLTSDTFSGVAINKQGTGLIFDPKTVTYYDWLEAGTRLGQLTRITTFALGDWMNFGQTVLLVQMKQEGINGRKREDESTTEWSDRTTKESEAVESKFDAAIAMTGLERQSLANIASVACKFSAKERVFAITGQLTFSHYQEVANVPERAKRLELLEKAAQDRLTVKELRALRQGKLPAPTPTPNTPTPGTTPTPTPKPTTEPTSAPSIPDSSPEIDEASHKALLNRIGDYVTRLTEIREFLKLLSNPHLLDTFYGVLCRHSEEWANIVARIDSAHDIVLDEEDERLGG